MNKDFEKCLKSRRIAPQEWAPNLVDREMSDAHYDIEKAEISRSEGDNKWATIKAYYSMFHASRALLYVKGFREQSHQCLKYAMQALFVDEGLLDQKYVNDFDATMILRETADYQSDFSKETAEVALENAHAYLARTEELLKSLRL